MTIAGMWRGFVPFTLGTAQSSSVKLTQEEERPLCSLRSVSWRHNRVSSHSSPPCAIDFHQDFVGSYYDMHPRSRKPSAVTGSAVVLLCCCRSVQTRLFLLCRSISPVLGAEAMLSWVTVHCIFKLAQRMGCWSRSVHNLRSTRWVQKESVLC